MSTVEKMADRVGELFALQGDQLRAEIAAAMQATTNALKMRGAIPKTPPAGAGSALLLAAPGVLMGWTLRNSAGVGNVTLNLWDSRDTSGQADRQLVGTCSIGASSDWQQAEAWFGPGGVSFGDALTAEVLATGGGLLAGVVYLDPQSGP